MKEKIKLTKTINKIIEFLLKENQPNKEKVNSFYANKKINNYDRK